MAEPGTQENVPPGQRKVSGVIAAGVSRLEHKLRQKNILWPEKGKPLNGTTPGMWKAEGLVDETGELPEDCPVRALGYDGENYYFEDTSGQIFNTGDKALGVERMQKLFAGNEDFLCWAWPSWSGKGAGADVTNFKTEEARRDLFAACRDRGPWSPTDMVRGRGAWSDEQGRLILHCGEFLWVEGNKPDPMTDTGEVGDYFYVRRPKSISPWNMPVHRDDNPAVQLVEILRTWNFVRGDVDVMLLLGWIGVALMGAALDWRPSVFLVGDAGTGKSELHRVLKAILGRGMISTTNATSAGLYQLVGHDALPICIDEIEGEDSPDQAQQIIKMARDAASGSVRIRGGANHQGVEFSARSTFLFSAINPPPLPPASLSRLAVLQLRALQTRDGKAPTIKAAETIGPMLLRRIVDSWREWPGRYEAYRKTLRDNGHSSRGQNTFGTFLAAAHLLLGDEGMDDAGLPWEKLESWGIQLAADVAPEVSGGQANWAKCIEEILTSPIDAWNKGDRHTIGQLLSDLIDDRNAATFGGTREKLAAAGLGLLEVGKVGEGYGLAVPIGGREINRLLQDTAYAGKGSNGGWDWALQQAPAPIVKAKVVLKTGKDPDNRVTIGGAQRRCRFISLKDLRDWQEERG